MSLDAGLLNVEFVPGRKGLEFTSHYAVPVEIGVLEDGTFFPVVHVEPRKKIVFILHSNNRDKLRIRKVHNG